MTSLLISVLLVLGLMSSGCKSFVNPEDYRLLAEPYKAQAHAEQATVIFLWADRRFEDMAVPLYQDGVLVGALKSTSYARHLVQPGAYAFSTNLVWLESVNETVSLRVEAGKQYFLRFHTGGFDVPPRLELIGQDIAVQQLLGLPRTEIVNLRTNGDPRPEQRTIRAGS